MTRVLELRQLSMTPTLSSLIGTCASQTVMNTINDRYGGSGGVIFGQVGDPYQERYRTLLSQITTHLAPADNIVRMTTEVLLNPDVIRPITDEDALYCCPASMRLPILMYPPVHALMMDDRISGYGYEKDDLPDEDVFGRLIDNGRVQLTGHAGVTPVPEYITWTWKSDDPKLTDKDLEAIEQTRTWLDIWLYKQMMTGGDYRDPTDPSNTIRKNT